MKGYAVDGNMNLTFGKSVIAKEKWFTYKKKWSHTVHNKITAIGEKKEEEGRKKEKRIVIIEFHVTFIRKNVLCKKHTSLIFD